MSKSNRKNVYMELSEEFLGGPIITDDRRDLIDQLEQLLDELDWGNKAEQSIYISICTGPEDDEDTEVITLDNHTIEMTSSEFRKLPEYS